MQTGKRYTAHHLPCHQEKPHILSTLAWSLLLNLEAFAKNGCAECDASSGAAHKLEEAGFNLVFDNEGGARDGLEESHGARYARLETNPGEAKLGKVRQATAVSCEGSVRKKSIGFVVAATGAHRPERIRGRLRDLAARLDANAFFHG